jgi:uncharacterized membrane protein (UPF0136 family)
MGFRKFMSFERMVTPLIIRVFFWIGVVIAILTGLAVVVGGVIGGLREENFLLVVGGLVGGPLAILLGVLMVRIYAELLILAFRINETLTDIKVLLEKKQ